MSLDEYRELQERAKQDQKMVLDAVEESTLALGGVQKAPVRKRKRRKNTAYAKAFKKVQSKYKLKSGKWKKGGFGRAVREAHKIAKRSRK